jgi:hypothetical protein
MELSDEDIVNMERSRHTRNRPTILSFASNTQYIYWTQSRNQATQAWMKSYTVEVTDPSNPNLGQGDSPALYFPPPKIIMQMLRYKDHKKKSG